MSAQKLGPADREDAANLAAHAGPNSTNRPANQMETPDSFTTNVATVAFAN